MQGEEEPPPSSTQDDPAISSTWSIDRPHEYIDQHINEQMHEIERDRTKEQYLVSSIIYKIVYGLGR